MEMVIISLRGKAKTAAYIKREQDKVENFIKNGPRKHSKEADENLLLHSYLETETWDGKKRFIRDMVIRNRRLDKNASDAPSAEDYENETDIRVGERKDEENGKDLGAVDEKLDDFEEKYNF